MEQVVDIPLPHIMEEMMEVERSTWQNRCVLRGCASVDVVRHAFHLVQILRAQAIRSQVSSCSVETESTDGSHAVFPVSPDFFFRFFQLGKVQNFPARLTSSELRLIKCHLAGYLRTGGVVAHSSSSELSAHQMAPAGVITHWRSRRALQLVSHVLVLQCGASAGHVVEYIVMGMMVGNRRAPGATILGWRAQVRHLPTIIFVSRRRVLYFVQWTVYGWRASRGVSCCG